MTDAPHMHGRPSLVRRTLAALFGDRDKRVGVLVNTTRGVKTVQIRLRDLRLDPPPARG
jgi:hypothetical protein